jgi:hypothetical protein
MFQRSVAFGFLILFQTLRRITTQHYSHHIHKAVRTETCMSWVGEIIMSFVPDLALLPPFCGNTWRCTTDRQFSFPLWASILPLFPPYRCGPRGVLLLLLLLLLALHQAPGSAACSSSSLSTRRPAAGTGAATVWTNRRREVISVSQSKERSAQYQPITGGE